MPCDGFWHSREGLENGREATTGKWHIGDSDTHFAVCASKKSETGLHPVSYDFVHIKYSRGNGKAAKKLINEADSWAFPLVASGDTFVCRRQRYLEMR